MELGVCPLRFATKLATQGLGSPVRDMSVSGAARRPAPRRAASCTASPWMPRIEAGTTDTPEFQVDAGGLPVPLKTRFTAIVDGSDGL